MERRRFGDTDVEVSAIALECRIFSAGQRGDYTQDDCNRLCSFALDQGITYFDTADVYGNGRAESLLGGWMKSAGVDRSKIQIGSKFGYDFDSEPRAHAGHHTNRQDFSQGFMRTALERSLKRLGTDYLDLYMAHDIRLPQFRGETFAELEKLRTEGKIRLWGVTLGPEIGWREEGFKAMIEHGAKAVQTVYNLFQQNPGREFCETARSQRAGIIACGHDYGSILKDSESDRSAEKDDQLDESWKVFGRRKRERIRRYAADHGMTVHQLACKWLLMDPALTSITATLLNEKEIREAAESTQKPNLTKAELDQITSDYSENWQLGPEAHPCDLGSNTDPTGKVRSGYVPPPVLLA